jgi:tRNA nucleotidyltransferase (CCA-adding enzyme)
MIELKRPDPFDLVKKIKIAGLQPYWVGGCIRSQFQNLYPNDIDIAVIGDKEKVYSVIMDICSETGVMQCSLINNEKGTIEVKSVGNSNIYQIVPTGGKDIYEDLSLRDFTINAIALTEDKVIDPFNGLHDNIDRVVRVVSEKCFKRSPIRILRAYRMNNSFHPKTRELMIEDKHLLLNAPREMWLSEMDKILVNTYIFPIVNEMYFSGVLQIMIPEFSNMHIIQQPVEFHDYNVLVHTLHTIDHANYKIRWAALLHDIGKAATHTIDKNEIQHFYHHDMIGATIARTICERFRMPNKRTEEIVTLVENHMRLHSYNKDCSDNTILKIDRQLGTEITDKLIYLAEADINAGSNAHKNERLSILDRFRDRLMLLRRRIPLVPILPSGIGSRIKEITNTNGPIIGKIKKTMEDMEDIVPGKGVNDYDKEILDAWSTVLES